MHRPDSCRELPTWPSVLFGIDREDSVLVPFVAGVMTGVAAADAGADIIGVGALLERLGAQRRRATVDKVVEELLHVVLELQVEAREALITRCELGELAKDSGHVEPVWRELGSHSIRREGQRGTRRVVNHVEVQASASGVQVARQQLQRAGHADVGNLPGVNRCTKQGSRSSSCLNDILREVGRGPPFLSL